MWSSYLEMIGEIRAHLGTSWKGHHLRTWLRVSTFLNPQGQNQIRILQAEIFLLVKVSGRTSNQALEKIHLYLLKVRLYGYPAEKGLWLPNIWWYNSGILEIAFWQSVSTILSFSIDLTISQVNWPKYSRERPKWKVFSNRYGANEIGSYLTTAEATGL